MLKASKINTQKLTNQHTYTRTHTLFHIIHLPGKHKSRDFLINSLTPSVPKEHHWGQPISTVTQYQSMKLPDINNTISTISIQPHFTVTYKNSLTCGNIYNVKIKSIIMKYTQ